MKPRTSVGKCLALRLLYTSFLAGLLTGFYRDQSFRFMVFFIVTMYKIIQCNIWKECSLTIDLFMFLP
ncbi:hypothetical protein T03_13994 [Trichinella britovi]|uniref:Uncharacterized protein n=1 Tax=Trichinella britovi TaxID=45882 RepID=A0A0V1DBB1_TRIBR|nr:hypothetical protein T03_13994 [Trichinella britovi]